MYTRICTLVCVCVCVRTRKRCHVGDRERGIAEDTWRSIRRAAPAACAPTMFPSMNRRSRVKLDTMMTDPNVIDLQPPPMVMNRGRTVFVMYYIHVYRVRVSVLN